MYEYLQYHTRELIQQHRSRSHLLDNGEMGKLYIPKTLGHPKVGTFTYFSRIESNLWRVWLSVRTREQRFCSWPSMPRINQRGCPRSRLGRRHKYAGAR